MVLQFPSWTESVFTVPSLHCEERAEVISSLYTPSPCLELQALMRRQSSQHVWGPAQIACDPLFPHTPFSLGLSYRWLLNEFPNFIPTDGRHFVSQTTGNLYIARTNASDLGNYSCLATSHMDFSTKSVFSKFAQLNLAAEGQDLG